MCSTNLLRLDPKLVSSFGGATGIDPNRSLGLGVAPFVQKPPTQLREKQNDILNEAASGAAEGDSSGVTSESCIRWSQLLAKRSMNWT